MKLYWSDVLAPRKVCALAKYLGLPVEYVYRDLARGEHKTPEYLALNPNGKVPTLVDGSHSLWEADAILCYLAVHAESDLWPRDGRQVDVIRWFSWNQQHFNRAAGGLYFEHIIKPRFKLGDPDLHEVTRARDEFRHCAGILDAHLRDRRWLVGDSITVADFAVAVTLPYAGRAQIPLAEFPAVHRWHERLCELEAWRDPFPQLAVAA